MGKGSILFRVLVAMLASSLMTFAIVFIASAAVIFIITAAASAMEGHISIKPLPILLFSMAFAFAAAWLRRIVMKKYSRIRV